jgi:alkylation response protein AidB-like acyl-CoA dehydrogenase
MVIKKQIECALRKLKEDPTNFRDVYKEVGLFGISIQEKYGGSELPLQDVLEVVSLISQTGLSGPAMLGSHFRICHYITHFGTSEQKKKYLPKLASGECLAAHARTEHDSPVRTKRENEDYVLDGIKPYVTNARDAGLLAVTANDNNDIFLVESDNPNIVIGEDMPRVGVLDISLCSVYLNDCHVPPNALLGGSEDCAQEFLAETKVHSLMNYTARAYGALHGLKSLLLESPAKALSNRDHILANIEARISNVKIFLDEAINQFGSKSSSLPEYISSARAQSAQFCIETLIEMQSSYMYTNKTFARLYCDIPSLAIIGGRK